MKEYAISVPDGMDTTVLLSDEDAKRAGLLSDEGVKAKTADPEKVDADERAKAEREARQKAAEEADAAKAADALNKMQTPANTGGGGAGTGNK